MTDLQEVEYAPPGMTFPAWRPLPGYEQAACAGQDVDKYHPEGNTGISEAKMDCFWCPLGRNGGVDGPLVDSCLEYAMDMESSGSFVRTGVWGGTTPQDRNRIQAGTMTTGDLFGVCEWCGDPMPTTHGRRFCSDRCGYRSKMSRGKAA